MTFELREEVLTRQREVVRAFKIEGTACPDRVMKCSERSTEAHCPEIGRTLVRQVQTSGFHPQRQRGSREAFRLGG